MNRASPENIKSCSKPNSDEKKIEWARINIFKQDSTTAALTRRRACKIREKEIIRCGDVGLITSRTKEPSTQIRSWRDEKKVTYELRFQYVNERSDSDPWAVIVAKVWLFLQTKRLSHEHKSLHAVRRTRWELGKYIRVLVLKRQESFQLCCQSAEEKFSKKPD